MWASSNLYSSKYMIIHHKYDKEITTASPQERDWKGIGTALLVILFICSIIMACVFLFTPLSASEKMLRPPLTLRDLTALRPPLLCVEWFDNRNLHIATAAGIYVLDIDTGTQERLLDRETVPPASIIVPSFDRQYLAIFSPAPNPGMNPLNVSYFISIKYRKNQVSYKVSAGAKETSTQKAFIWNPKSNSFVFVQDNHVYYSDYVETDPIRISDGKGEHGLFDWVYNEEIFNKRAAIWWAPSGDLLAFASTANKAEKTIVLTSYIKDISYPIVSELPYPKVNDRHLPKFYLSIWNRKTRQTNAMDVQLRDSLAHHYLFAVHWIKYNGKETLIAIWTNRFQNFLSFTLCATDTAICKLVFEYKYPYGTYSSPEDFRSIAVRNESVYIILPKAHKDGNTYQHIASVLLDSGNVRTKPTFFSLGPYDIQHIYSLKEKSNSLYFLAAAPAPTSRHLFVVDIVNEESHCITCGMPNCTFQSNIFTPDMEKLLINCQGPSPPRVFFSKFKNTTTLGQMVEVTDNSTAHYHTTIENTAIPLVINDTVPLGNSFYALFQLVLPFDQMEKANYRSLPLLVYVYAGPNSQSVTDAFKLDFEEFLASNKQYAVLRIDGRGAANRGWRYKTPIIGALGSVEISDQIEATRRILNRYPFLDSSRTAIYGWSYGGFASLNVVEMAPRGYFKCAISVAPVTNFLYYDATYTERYMGNAQPQAYATGDVTRPDIEKFNTTRLLLMHGLQDDNVHFQNSAIFIEELQKQGIDFDLMVYPNQAHSISRRRDHVYKKIMNFLERCFA
ncbi:hypothetical protein WR25_01437 [Diploscapter pachys]|uniref:Peptidase S9 prolyl oligopeptidase catalytic domain-containing protein n=1 Tax=Diploscapter pachys TaxID=2018661 RepID=A0A2A2JPA4_9BILA|nr:hypothetical protein WR25_01437 [Diploscapter pachys]